MKNFITILTAIIVTLAFMACTKDNSSDMSKTSPNNNTGTVDMPQKTGDVFVDVWVNFSLRPATVPVTYDYFAQLSEPVPFKVEIVANTGETFVIDTGKTTSEKKQWPLEYGEPTSENCFSSTVNPEYKESGEAKYYLNCDR